MRCFLPARTTCRTSVLSCALVFRFWAFFIGACGVCGCVGVGDWCDTGCCKGPFVYTKHTSSSSLQKCTGIQTGCECVWGGVWGGLSVGVNKFTDTRQSIYPARQMSQAFSKSTAEQPPFRPTIKRSLSRWSKTFSLVEFLVFMALNNGLEVQSRDWPSLDVFPCVHEAPLIYSLSGICGSSAAYHVSRRFYTFHTKIEWYVCPKK